MTKDLEQNRNAILDAAARHGARNVRVFGSVARGDDRPDSDIDFLVEMGQDRSLLDLVALEQELEALLRRPVDVLTEESLTPSIRRRTAYFGVDLGLVWRVVERDLQPLDTAVAALLEGMTNEER